MGRSAKRVASAPSAHAEEDEDAMQGVVVSAPPMAASSIQRLGDDDDYVEEDDGSDVEDADEEEGEDEERPSSDLYRLPTADEMRELKETSELYKSNVFRLQLTELLSEVSVKHESLSKLEGALHRLKADLAVMPERAEMPASDAHRKLSKDGVNVPFDLPAVCNYSLAFQRPSDLSIVGSYLVKTHAKPQLAVDVALEMPAALFQPKDIQHYRYHHKRAYFLACVAAYLSKRPGLAALTFESFNGDMSRPVLVMRAAKGDTAVDFSKTGFLIRLLPTVAPGTFKLDRLAPGRSNLRDGDTSSSAAHYNNAILTDMFMKHHVIAVHSALAAVPSIAEASRLLRVWLRQRQLDRVGGITGFIATMVLVHLQQIRKLSRAMSEFQSFRLALQFIAAQDWRASPIAMQTFASNEHSDLSPELDTFSAAFDTVMLDGSGRLNLMADVSRGTMLFVQKEARLALAMIDSPDDRFSDLFLRPLQPVAVFDHLFAVDTTVADAPHLARALSGSLIVGALADRCHLVASWIEQGEADCSWPLKSAKPSSRPVTVWGGLEVSDAAAAGKLVVMGPPADQADAAAAFRRTWGSRSELRRFRDGSIVEAVVFSRPDAQRHLVVCDMLTTLLSVHHPAAVPSLRFRAPRADALLRRLGPNTNGKRSAAGAARPTSAEDPVRAAGAAFEALAKRVRGARALPLSVHAVLPASAHLRGTAVMPAEAHAARLRKVRGGVQSYAAPIEAVITFESSTRWPDDATAADVIKSAFYARLAASLSEDDGPATFACVDYVDVLFGGFAFRLRIAIEHQVKVMAASDDATHRALLPQYEMWAVHLPAHHSLVHTIASSHGAYRLAVRLASRWASSHFFSGALLHETIELLMASVFVNAGAFAQAGSALSALVRFWRLLAETDFEETPITVSPLEYPQSHVDETFKAIRALPNGGGAPLVIFSRCDKTGTLFTSQLDRIMFSRVVKFARAAWKQACEAPFEDITSLFRTPLQGYDAVISLRWDACARSRENIDAARWKPIDDAINFVRYGADQEDGGDGDSETLVGFDPAIAFVAELQQLFGHLALFLYDEHGGRHIAVVWKPQASAPTASVAVAHAFMTAPTGKGTVAADLAEVLEACKALGGGLVESIETKRAM